MRTFYVEVDTNDGDYVGHLVNVKEEDVEKWMPLIEKIKNFKPYTSTSYSGSTWTHRSNFPISECCRTDLGEKSPCELYGITEDEQVEFQEIFNIWGSEWGFHTISGITEIKIIKRML